MIAPVARAVGLWPLLPPTLDEAPITFRDSGSDTSWWEALITSGLLARAGDTVVKKSEKEKSHEKWGIPLWGTIETSWPVSAFGGGNLIPDSKPFANDIPSIGYPRRALDSKKDGRAVETGDQGYPMPR